MSGTDPMDRYERREWEQLRRRQSERARRAAPPAEGSRVGRLLGLGARGARVLPGADVLGHAVQAAVTRLGELGGRLAVATVDQEAVLAAYRAAGAEVSRLEDIRSLPLWTVDRVRPRLDLRYATAAAGQGLLAATAITAVDALVAGESVATAGAGAAPGVGVVVAAVAADAIGVLVASRRAVAHVASYYGYDVRRPDEEVLSLGVMGLGVSPQSLKEHAYRELDDLVQALAKREAWRRLDDRVATRVAQRVLGTLGVKLTRRRLAEALPLVGIPVAAAANARTVLGVVAAADDFYRARFLQDRYGVALPRPAAAGAAGEDGAEGELGAAGEGGAEGELVEIVDAELLTRKSTRL